jgi:HEAT repeat protein
VGLEPDTRSQAELINALHNGSPEEQKATLKRLAVVGDAEALDAVVDYLRGRPSDLRAEGLETLRVLAHKFVPSDRYSLADVLITFLKEAAWGQKLTATRLLSAHPNELAVDALRTLVQQAQEKVRAEHRRRFSPARILAERILSESILALANCGGLRVLPTILEFLEDPGLRPIATRALGLIGSETERPRLEDLIEDDSVQVRDAAQWALGLMDQRNEQFMLPPDQQPEPPPDRLTPLYWMHRQLRASDDDLLQFLIVRVAIEHLIVDAFLSEGRIPEECFITLRRYTGSVPPEFKRNQAEIVGTWKYEWRGPELEKLDEPRPARPLDPDSPPGHETSITISYPIALHDEEEGLVSFDCLFGPFFGRGWIYQIARRGDTWSFALLRRTWTS